MSRRAVSGRARRRLPSRKTCRSRSRRSRARRAGRGRPRRKPAEPGPRSRPTRGGAGGGAGSCRPVGHVPGEIDIPDGVAVLEGSPSGADRTVGDRRLALQRRDLEPAARVGARGARGGRRGAGADHCDAGAGRVRASDRRDGAREDAPLLVRRRPRLRRARRDGPFRLRRAEAASGLQLAGLETGVPVAFGVLTVDTSSRRRRASARAPRRPAPRSRWPTSSRRCAPRRAQRASEASAILPPMSKVCAICGKKPGFGQPPEPLDGRHEAALRAEPPARPRPAQGKATRAYVCTRCLKAGKVQKAL